MVKITITGIGGKTHLAEHLYFKAKNSGLNCEIYDGYLFKGDKKFDSRLKKVWSNHKKVDADISIVVIGNSGTSINVNFEGRMNFNMLQTLFDEKHSN